MPFLGHMLVSNQVAVASVVQCVIFCNQRFTSQGYSTLSKILEVLCDAFTCDLSVPD